MEHLNLVLGYVYILLGVIIICYLISCFLRTDRCVPCFCFVCLITAIPFFFDDRIGFLIYVLFVSALYIVLEIVWVRTRILRLLQNLRFIFILSLTILVGYIVARLMVHKFNNDSWWINENNISDRMEDWGDFATFFGGIFALISIYLAYRAFISQVNASRRASFDATFTQIFAQHKILYDKAMQHNDEISFTSDYDKNRVEGNVNNNIFSICKNEYIKHKRTKHITKSDGKEYNISDFWKSFNKCIESSASVDFKNYFKYIHNEVEFVASQPDDVLNDDAKQRYIQLIQAQMNNDELFCYLINKVEFMYRSRSNPEKDTRIHAEHLRSFRFFIELCRGRSGHVDLVKMMLRDKELDVSAFIDENWIQKGKS